MKKFENIYFKIVQTKSFYFFIKECENFVIYANIKGFGYNKGPASSNKNLKDKKIAKFV